MDGKTACPACGEPVPFGTRFCGACGAPLTPRCPACGTENRPGTRFCEQCGAPLVAVASVPGNRSIAPAAVQTKAAPAPVHTVPPVEERRLISALFCDLVGFTPLAEALDPEEVREIQTAYFSAMTHEIERYGGTVEKYAGDAVLALFGVPAAHEDDAERAVLCALGMQTAIEPVADEVRHRWSVEPAIRIGVTTGEVVSGAWDLAQGASGRQDAAVTGDTVNTAARLQAAAAPGTVLVGGETMRLTRRRIRYGPEQRFTLKGKAEPVPAFVALGTQDQIGERWEMSPFATPLVGREPELNALYAAWERVQEGNGQLVTIVGDAGVGKSRLLAELVERAAADGGVRLFRGRCLSYGQSIGLWLLTDLLRGLFTIGERDSPELVRGRVDAILTDVFRESDEDRREAGDVLGEVLGLPVGGSVVSGAGPQIRRQALVRSLRHVLRALATEHPVIMLLEDLHWVDGASQDVLAEVLIDVPGLRLLVLAVQRPGWNPPWGEWGWTERITLHAMSERDAARLVRAVLGGDAARLSSELEGYVGERAGGNPFFVEELLNALQETGGLLRQGGELKLAQGAAAKLPATLTELLLARLDRLEKGVKQVAQVGSVIGRSFAVRLLALMMESSQAALESPLTGLQQAELAFPRRTTELEYVFKHVLVREVAYGMLVSRRRRALHLQVARAIARLYPPAEYVELIAYHYARTEEHAEAAEWSERAGDRAAAIYATATALEHYQETIRRLELLDADQMATARVEEKRGATLYAAGRYDEALDELARAAELYRTQHDGEAAGRVTALMGMAHRYRGTPEAGIELVRPAVESVARDGPSAAHAALYIALAHLQFLVGRYREQQDAAERAAAIAREIGDDRLLGEAEERRATALNQLDRSEEALEIFQRAIPLIEAGGDLPALWRAFNNAAVDCNRLGRMEDCRQFTERALAVAERVGNPDQIAFTLSNLCSALITLGDWDGARGHLERAMATLGERRPASAALVLEFLGLLALYQGRWEEAKETLDEALAVARRTGARQQFELTQAGLAELDISMGKPEDAVDRLEALVKADDAHLLILPSLARAYLETGAVERAEAVATEAVRRARAGDQRFDLLEALLVQGMVLAGQARGEEAEVAFEEGLMLGRALPYPYLEARVLHQLSLLRQRRGERTEAAASLEAALAIFRRLGAQKDVELCTASLQATAGDFAP